MIQPIAKALARVGPRDEFDGSTVYLFETSLDLPPPRLFDAFIDRLIQTAN